ncbi:hypothetical protein [Marinicellulosiphila megalodicopiae]|uniref:hypothetical protein n=1 Tax=Marinicellulosiphila megalodicopiae TaxID=2724896 RepID=UPI003BAEBD25
MLSRIRSILTMEIKIPNFNKETEVSLLEYGITPDEVLANYIEARDHGQPQKAYNYISKKDKHRVSLAKFEQLHETDPFIADTVNVINQRSKNQKFVITHEQEHAAVVRWLTNFPKLFCTLPQYEIETEHPTCQADSEIVYETEAQSIDFELIKEGAYWRVVLSQYDVDGK